MVLAAGVSMLLGNIGRAITAASQSGNRPDQREEFARQTVAASVETVTRGDGLVGDSQLPPSTGTEKPGLASEQMPSPDFATSLAATSFAFATGDSSTKIADATISAHKTATANARSSDWRACHDAPLSRLRIGMRAYVSFDPPLANRVRVEAGTHAQIIGYIDPGEEIAVIEGPACADGWVWWRVRSAATGLTGWTAEGDENDYWLIPID